MKIDAENYKDGLRITGMYCETAWVRKSLAGTYDVQVGNGVLTLLDAYEIVTLGEALVKYGKERHSADVQQQIAASAGSAGA